MTGNRLYLVSCDNPQLSQYFEQLTVDGVPETIYQQYVNTEDEGPLHLWGLSENKGQRWSRMETGDILLFYTVEGEYRYAARVRKFEQNEALCQALETSTVQNGKSGSPLNRWQYCIYLEPPFRVTIDSAELHNYAGHSRNRPFNFSRMNDQGREFILEKHGSIEAYVQSKREESPQDTSQSDSEVVEQFESLESIVEQIVELTSSRASSVQEDVSKLDDRGLSYQTIYQTVKQRHDSNDKSSILAVDAIGTVRAGRLIDAGFETVTKLADASIEELSSVPEISDQTARVIHDHATEIVSNQDTAGKIASTADDPVSEIETTLKVVGTTGVPRSEAQSIVAQLHTHPSLLDIHGIQPAAAYHLMDQGYETPEQVANADSDALTEIPRIGDGSVDTLQSNAADFAAEVEFEDESPKVLSSLDSEERTEVARVLGVTDLESLSEQELDSVLTSFFSKLVESPFEIRLQSEK